MLKPKKKGQERSHGRNMPNPKKRWWIHISRSPHPPHFSREVVPRPTSGGDKLSTHRRTPGLEKDEERKQILIHNNRPIVEKSMSKEHQFIKMLFNQFSCGRRVLWMIPSLSRTSAAEIRLDIVSSVVMPSICLQRWVCIDRSRRSISAVTDQLSQPNEQMLVRRESNTMRLVVREK
jgi:hypothetical protein